MKFASKEKYYLIPQRKKTAGEHSTEVLYIYLFDKLNTVKIGCYL